MSIRQAITKGESVPNAARIQVLEDRLRGHLGLLLDELDVEADEKPADDELETMLREAKGLLKSTPDPAAGRLTRWKHIEIMGYSTKGLLRLYAATHAAD